MKKLEDLLKDIEDVNEPACMDRLYQYLEQIQEEDEQFMELLLDRLKNEIVTWEQPWYQQSNSLSRPVKHTNMENQSEQYILRNISKAEHDKIVKNWLEFIKASKIIAFHATTMCGFPTKTEFVCMNMSVCLDSGCKLYKLPDRLDCLARWKNTKCKLPTTPQENSRRFAVAFMARGLQRTLYQVFRHIMTYFGGPVKGAYSPTEEKIMRICFEQEPHNCVTILSRVLHREPRGIYKRLHQIYNGTPERTVKLKLSLPVATKLVKLLLKYTGLPLEELKNKRIQTSVWVKVGEEMNHPYIYIQSMWYYKLHVQLYVKTNLKLNRLRKRAFKLIRSSPYQVWTDIRWNDLAKEFPDGVTSGFLYRLCATVAREFPKYLSRPLSEVVELALYKFKSKPNKRRLKCLEMTEEEELKEMKFD